MNAISRSQVTPGIFAYGVGYKVTSGEPGLGTPLITSPPHKLRSARTTIDIDYGFPFFLLLSLSPF